MKTNKEKYTNTDDALAAFRKHKEECKCDCKFESWLKQPCDEELEKAFKDMPKRLSMALAGILAGKLVADSLEKGLTDTPKTVADENADIECPLCHGKCGKIDGVIISAFHCPDCGAMISCATKGITSRTELAGWLLQFNKKQD